MPYKKRLNETSSTTEEDEQEYNVKLAPWIICIMFATISSIVISAFLPELTQIPIPVLREIFIAIEQQPRAATGVAAFLFLTALVIALSHPPTQE